MLSPTETDDDTVADGPHWCGAFDEDEARWRATQNLRTRNKVRELQRNMHMRRAARGNDGIEQMPPPSAASSAAHALSAPEDTSAKESSAGRPIHVISSQASARA